MTKQEAPQCPVCENYKVKKLFVSHNQHGRHVIDAADTFDVFLCGDCESIFLGNIEMNEDYYKTYYQSDYYENTSRSLSAGIGRVLTAWSILIKERLILAECQTKKQISILDVGCGTGGFLLGLRQAQFVKHGVEINAQAAGICKKRGLDVYQQNLTDIDFKGKKFAAVTMWHVLEHVHNPLPVLKKIHSLLVDDGLLLFQVPNTASLGFRYGQADWFHLDSPRHLVLYNQNSIQKLCAQSGFRVALTKNEWYDYPLDLFWSVRKSIMRFVLYPLYPLVKLLSPEALTFVCKKV